MINISSTLAILVIEGMSLIDLNESLEVNFKNYVYFEFSFSSGHERLDGCI